MLKRFWHWLFPPNTSEKRKADGNDVNAFFSGTSLAFVVAEACAHMLTVLNLIDPGTLPWWANLLIGVGGGILRLIVRWGRDRTADKYPPDDPA